MINLLTYLQSQQPSASSGGHWILRSFPMGNNIELSIDGACTVLYNNLQINNDDPVIDMAACSSPAGQYVFEYHNLTLPLCTMPFHRVILTSTSGVYTVSLAATSSSGCSYSLLVLDSNTFQSNAFTPVPVLGTNSVTMNLSAYSNSCGVADPIPNNYVSPPINLALVASSELDGPSGPAPIPNVEYLVDISFNHQPSNTYFFVEVDPTSPTTVIPAPYSAADLYAGSPNFEAAILATIQAGFQANGINWFSPFFQVKRRATAVDVYFPLYFGTATNWVGPLASNGQGTTVTYQPMGSGTQLIMGDAINYGNFNQAHNPTFGGSVNTIFSIQTGCGTLEEDVTITAGQIINSIQPFAYNPNINVIPISPEYYSTTVCPVSTVTATPNIPCPTTPVYQWTVDGINYANSSNVLTVSDPPATVVLTYTCDGCSSTQTIDI